MNSFSVFLSFFLHSYIHIHTAVCKNIEPVYKCTECIVGRISLENLLPATEMWINADDFFFTPREVFILLKLPTMPSIYV